MGTWKDFFLGPQTTMQATPPQRRSSFSAPIGSDWETWQTLIQINNGGLAKVSRAEILAVPGFVRARDIFCDLGNLPLKCFNADGVKIERKLLSQPENTRGRVRAVTMANTIEDLLFDSSSLWVVTDRDSTFYPTAVQHVPIGEWTLDGNGVVRWKGDVVPAPDVILFESPNQPLRQTAASTVRTARLLELAANKYAATPEMNAYFQSNGDGDPTEDEIAQFLADYESKRRANGPIGMLPEGVELHEVKRMTPEEMMLISSREWCVAEASRLTGVSPNWLALNITSRTYNSATDERRDFIDFPASPYIRSIEQRLSMGDVTPSTQTVRFNLDSFLRANTPERYNAYTVALAGGWLTLDEIRTLEDLPPLPQPGEGDDNG